MFYAGIMTGSEYQVVLQIQIVQLGPFLQFINS